MQDSKTQILWFYNYSCTKQLMFLGHRKASTQTQLVYTSGVNVVVHSHSDLSANNCFKAFVGKADILL